MEKKHQLIGKKPPRVRSTNSFPKEGERGGASPDWRIKEGPAHLLFWQLEGGKKKKKNFEKPVPYSGKGKEKTF